MEIEDWRLKNGDCAEERRLARWGMRLVFLAVLVTSSFFVGEALALSPELQELGERLEAINREAERLAAEKEAMEASFWRTGPGQVAAFALLVVGMTCAVIWIALPFMVNGIRKNIKAMREAQDEERLAAASQRAAQLAQLKVIAHALTGAEIERAEAAPPPGPPRERFYRR